MNLIRRRIRYKFAGDQPYYKPFRYRGDDFKNTKDEAIIEYDVTFDVNAKLASGGLADFSDPNLKEQADKMIKILSKQIDNMNNASFQEEITDTVTNVVVQNIADNVFKSLSRNGKNYSKNIFNRTTAFLSTIDESSIYNNELKVHFKMELNTGTITEELAKALDEAYNSTKNHCCTQISKRMADFYKWEKQSGNGLEAIESVDIKFKSFSGVKLKTTHEPVTEDIDENDPEMEAIERVRKQIDLYRIRNNGYPQPRQIRVWCQMEGVDPAYFRAASKK